MTASLFIDTSCFFALLNKSDAHHDEAEKQLSTSVHKVTSNYIFDELMTLLTARGQKELSIEFGEKIRSESLLDYHFLTPQEEEKAWQIYTKFKDHILSFTDCTTLTILSKQQNIRLLSFDKMLLKLAHQI